MPSLFPTACECTAPGWCARHKCHKDRTYFEFCRRLEPWFQLWERGQGPSSLAVPVQNSQAASYLCRHIGSEIRRQDCPTCRGHVELKIFACAVHRECALSPNAVAVSCCTNCADYEAPT
jgi:hypothetical protein